MEIRPTLEEVREYAATGKYDVLPLSMEILSDFTTPMEALKILKNASDHVYMLESAQANETWGRYTFLGLHSAFPRNSQPVIQILRLHVPLG